MTPIPVRSSTGGPIGIALGRRRRPRVHGLNSSRGILYALALGAETLKARQAKELHERVVQNLYALRMLDPRSDDRPFWENIEAITDAARAMSVRLAPPVLESYGLAEALRSLASDTSGCRIGLRLEWKEAAAPEVETLLFRIVQEAIDNVRQHSGVSAATIELTAGDRWGELRIGDLGVGFAVAQEALRQREQPGRGLARASAYARALGGRLTINSVPGFGTTIRVRFPVSPQLPP